MIQQPVSERDEAGERETSPPLRVAVIGCGALAMSQHLPNIVRSSRMVLQACCDVSRQSLEDCKRRFNVTHVTREFRDAVNDPEVQMICLATTEKLRLPVIEAAARAGKPIYVEKPLGRSLGEIYEIRNIIRQSGIAFCVGHNRRSAPAMIDAQQIFRRHMERPHPCLWRLNQDPDRRPRLAGDGVAGMSVRINDDWHSWKSWVFDQEQAPHGALLFEMTHFTDVCNWFLAAEPQEVVALQNDPFNHGVVIRYCTGEMATISMSANGTFGYPKELYECFGNGGAVIVDHMLEVRTAGIEGVSERTIYPMVNDRHAHVGTEGGVSGWLAKKHAACREAAEKREARFQFTAEPNKGHASALEAFVDEIQGSRRMVCGIEESVLATRVAFAAIKSAENKRAVRLDEI